MCAISTIDSSVYICVKPENITETTVIECVLPTADKTFLNATITNTTGDDENVTLSEKAYISYEEPTDRPVKTVYYRPGTKIPLIKYTTLVASGSLVDGMNTILNDLVVEPEMNVTLYRQNDTSNPVYNQTILLEDLPNVLEL